MFRKLPSLRALNIFLTLSFMLSGNTFLIYGLLALINADRYGSIPPFDKKYTDVPAMVVSSGITIFMSAWIQLFYLLKDKRYPVFKFATLVLVLWSVELVNAIFSYVQTYNMKETLYMTLSEYWIKENRSVSTIWHLIQETANCCGLYSPQDYGTMNLGIPYSCCGGDTNETCRNITEVRGCHPLLYDIIHGQFIEMGTFAVIVICLQFVIGACGFFTFRYTQKDANCLEKMKGDDDDGVEEDEDQKMEDSLNEVNDYSKISALNVEHCNDTNPEEQRKVNKENKYDENREISGDTGQK